MFHLPKCNTTGLGKTWQSLLIVHQCIFPNILITTRSQLVKNSGFNPPPVNCWSWPALHQSDRSPPGSTNRKRGGRRPGFYRRIYTTANVGLYGTALTLIAGRGRGNCPPSILHSPLSTLSTTLCWTMFPVVLLKISTFQTVEHPYVSTSILCIPSW